MAGVSGYLTRHGITAKFLDWHSMCPLRASILAPPTFKKTPLQSFINWTAEIAAQYTEIKSSHILPSVRYMRLVAKERFKLSSTSVETCQAVLRRAGLSHENRIVAGNSTVRILFPSYGFVSVDIVAILQEGNALLHFSEYLHDIDRLTSYVSRIVSVMQRRLFGRKSAIIWVGHVEKKMKRLFIRGDHTNTVERALLSYQRGVKVASPGPHCGGCKLYADCMAGLVVPGKLPKSMKKRGR
jgi:hypothetical protein